jgi:predicted RNase H-like nuclease (RuvC/YqgF family)
MTDGDADAAQTIKRLAEENAELRKSKEESDAVIAQLRDSLAAFRDDEKLRDRQSRLLLILSRENRILGKALIKQRAQAREVRQQLQVLNAIVTPEAGKPRKAQ